MALDEKIQRIITNIRTDFTSLKAINRQDPNNHLTAHPAGYHEQTLEIYVDRLQVLERGQVWDQCTVDPVLYTLVLAKALADRYSAVPSNPHELVHRLLPSLGTDAESKKERLVRDIVDNFRSLRKIIGPQIDSRFKQEDIDPRHEYQKLIGWILEREITAACDEYTDFTRHEVDLAPSSSDFGLVKASANRVHDYFMRFDPYQRDNELIHSARKLIRGTFKHISESLDKCYDRPALQEPGRVLRKASEELHMIDSALYQYETHNGHHPVGGFVKYEVHLPKKEIIPTFLGVRISRLKDEYPGEVIVEYDGKKYPASDIDAIGKIRNLRGTLTMNYEYIKGVDPYELHQKIVKEIKTL